MFELVFLSGAKAGEVVPVRGNLLAGRSPECSLEVPDPNASRKHTHLVFDGSHLVVSDNQSANGTFINEVRITGPVVVKHGDVLRLGETRLRIQEPRRGTASRLPDDAQSSSIFSFKEAEADLSSSVVVSVAPGVQPKGQVSPEMLRARLGAVMELSKALVNIDRLDHVNGCILDALFEVFPQAERGFLMKGNQPGKLVPTAFRQRDRSVAENLTVSNTICRKALESKSAFLFNDQNQNDFDQGMSIVSLKIRSAMTIPMMVGEEILGLMQIDTSDRARAFTKDDLELAVAASQLAAIALKNAEQLAKIESDATMKANLLRFVTGPVAEQVLQGSLDIGLGGKTYRGTIMFSDVVGFTRISESLEPAAVVRMMNDYFGRMVPCIERESGSVDKFIGDAIMAFWGIPFDRGEAALSACQAALDMQNAALGLNSTLRQSGLPELHTGIGLNTGAVVAGNIGVDKRLNYTLLGDAVNTSARVQHAACKGMVLASEATLAELKGAARGLHMPPLRVHNKAEPLRVISLRGLCQPNQELLLHIRALSGTHQATLVRRLADRTFIVLHPADCDICAVPLLSDCDEWTGVDLGRPTMVAVLPPQGSDGSLVRSQVILADPDLAGLLAGEPLVCQLGWDRVVR